MTAMNSCIYEGVVRHARHRPVRHKFSFRLFLLYLDLDEIDAVFADRLFWSANRPAPARFRRGDHLGDPDLPLDEAVRRLVRDRTGSRPGGPVRLLTHLSYFGYCFNPISIYFCFAPEGSAIEFLVMEVSNTPWRERHCYVLDTRGQTGRVLLQENQKQFHVSPFMGMQMRYRWAVGFPGEALAVSVHGSDAAGGMFVAEMDLNRVPISGASLARCLVKYPFITGRVLAAIYWHAFRLLLKGAPFFPHPGKRIDNRASGHAPPANVRNQIEKRSGGRN